uniref:Transmembrane protein 106 C-terminal domain-containing protein n=1 Tax=Petromyzon marinus TaxID=7757 RepID=S4RQU3_PETMA
VMADEANRLVALIPLNDHRLKPNKTLQYVLLSMLICLVTSGLLVFFIFPRSVLVSNGDIESVYVFFSENGNTVIMNVTTSIVIENSNYYYIDLYSTCIQVEFGHNVLNKTCFEKGLVVKPHSQGQVRLSIILSIFGIYEYCTKPSIKVHNVFFKLQ